MRPTPWVLTSLLLIPCAAFSQQQPQKQDPCTIKTEYEALLKQAVPAAGPKPAQPNLTRADVEAALKKATEQRDKAAIELKVDEDGLANVQIRLTELENRMRPRLSELNREVQDLNEKIAKARSADVIKGLEDSRDAKNNEIRRINTDIRELTEERRSALELVEGKPGVIEGSEKPFIAAEQIVTNLEQLLEQIDKYEKWTAAGQARTALAAKKAAYDKAVATKDQALAEAKQVVFDVRGKLTAERALLRAKERPKFLKSASYLADRAQLVARIKVMNAEQRAPLIRAYQEDQSAKLNAIVAAMIQPSKDSKNLRLTQLMTSLSTYDCWTDAANYKNTILRAMENASVVAGSDFTFRDTSGWEEIPFEEDVTGFPDVSGTWKASIGGIVRTIRQSGSTIRWSADYKWGSVDRHEDMQGTVSDLSSGSGIEVMITYTATGERTYKAGYSASASVDRNGKATSIRWSNGDVYTRVP